MNIKLYLFSLLLFISSCNKEKKAQDIYDAIPPTIISMSPQQEYKQMKGVTGCHGLILGKMTKEEVLKKMSSYKSLFASSHYKTDLFDKYIPDTYIESPNINTLSWEKDAIDNKIKINTIFVNDTLAQIILKYEFTSKLRLKDSLIKKYGKGNGEYKEAQFGIDKKGNLNLSDYCPGYEYRIWQNEDIVINYNIEKYISQLSNDKYYYYGGNQTAFYTSKIMAPKLISSLNEAYEKEKEAKIKDEKEELKNL